VFTAFSGSHQDAIHKGMHERQLTARDVWEVPYLPIDPADIGRTYEQVIRINSQSGKSGIAHVLERDHGYRVPKELAVALSLAVQRATDESGEEISSVALLQLFRSRYFIAAPVLEIREVQVCRGAMDNERQVEAEVRLGDQVHLVRGTGGGAIEAFANGLRGIHPGPWDIIDYAEHSRGAGASAEAVSYVAVSSPERAGTWFGVGQDRDVVLASFQALVTALVRMHGG